MAKVIFLQNIRGVAQIGDLKTVADGYARNFLLPRKLAVLASPSALKKAETLKQQRQKLLVQEKADAQILAQQIEKLTLAVTRAANEEGTLYDGLDSAEIARDLKKEGFNLEPEQIELERPLKNIGFHEITIKLRPEMETKLKVEIKKQEV